MITSLILSLGTPRYGDALFDLMHQQFSIRHMTVYRFRPDMPIKPLLAASRNDDFLLQQSQERYIAHFNTMDPIHPLLEPQEKSGVMLRHVAAHDIVNREFREELYGRARMAGKLVLIVNRPYDTISLSLFRGMDRGVFDEREIQTLSPWAELIAATLIRHFSEDAAPPDKIKKLSEICSRLPSNTPLSSREISVCARVLDGMTADGIAVDLNISVHSAITYRRRAYAKLGVTSVNQLFSLALGQFQQDQFAQRH